jgi:hypothetical protein
MPRSPARDLSDRYDKNRGYFRNRDPFWRWRIALSGVALALVVLWAAADVVQPKLTRYGHTHGRLAGVHAAYDDNCAACHKEYSLADIGTSPPWKTRERWHELTCEKCHSGPDHHMSLNEKGKDYHKVCSNCHHDHEGRLNSLVRLNDADCAKCHADLSKWTAVKSQYAEKITNFVTDHPPFRSLDIENKPRTLKFSHAVHMNPGAAYSPDGSGGLTLDQVATLSSPEAAERYKKPGQKGSDQVQLDCASCHQLDSGAGTDAYDKLKAQLDKFGQPAKAVQPLRGDGAYFQPVNFEAHCRACHPLAAFAGTAGGKVVPGFDLPHRVAPKALQETVKAGYLRSLLSDNKPVPEPKDPGGRLDTPAKPVGGSLNADLSALTDREFKRLLRANPGDAEKGGAVSSEGCFKCHTGTEQKLEPVADRTVWFEHAKFNHASHRGASCAVCHPGTEGRKTNRTDADKPEPVLIKGAATKDTKNLCATCHSPSGTNVTLDDGTKVSGGGVRHACTDCHRYHHGDLPLQGRGSATYDPRDEKTGKLKENSLLDWLKGVPVQKDK